jgi:protein-disulfide isomerase
MSSSANLPTRRTTKNRKRNSNSNLSLYLLGGGLVLLIALVIGINIWNSRPAAVSVAPPDVPAEWINRNVMGSPDAKIVIDAYEDFLCPACGQWTAQIKPQIFNDYIKTGKARFVYNYLPIHPPGSAMGAQAAECAADQGAFWQYHDQLFAAARTRGQAGFTLDALSEMASAVGLRASDFTSCMSGLKHQAAIAESQTRANSLQINSTPSVVVNGQLMSDPFDYNTLKSTIDRLVAGS